MPRWGASTITLRNVFVSRRPTTLADANQSEKSETAPAAFLTSSISPDTYLATPRAESIDNYTMFDINLDEVEVTLSIMRWLDGKGLVKDAKVKGVRGVIGERNSERI